jgi:hypothetical protein
MIHISTIYAESNSSYFFIKTTIMEGGVRKHIIALTKQAAP